MTESINDLLKRVEKELGDKLREWPYGGSHAVSTPIANRELIDRLAQSPPGACHGNGWARAMDIFQSDLVPKDTAYVVRKPEPFQVPFEPIEFLEEDYKPFRISTMVGYKLGPPMVPVLLSDLRLGVPRHAIHDCWEVDVEPKVKGPEPVVPAQPLSWWQWLVIVGFLSWILCALSRAV